MATLTQYVADQAVLTTALSDPRTGISGVTQGLASTGNIAGTREAACTGYASPTEFAELWWLASTFKQRITDQAVLASALTNSKTGVGRATTLLTTPRCNIRTHQITGTGYAGAATLTINGQELIPAVVPPSYPVYVGWNLIGFKSTAQRTAGEYLAGIAGKYVVIYGYDDGAWFVVESTDLMDPTRGYWIAVTADGTIYP